MIPISQARMKRMTAVHGWSGTLLGLLLYAVVLTGAVAVFAPEIGRWSAGTPRQVEPLKGNVDEVVRTLADSVHPEFRDDVGLWAGDGNDIYVAVHGHALNPESGEEEDIGSIFRADADTGAILGRNNGFFWNDPSSYDESPLRQFIVALHVELYLPDPWGLILTGILGLMMMAAVVTGFLMHRHLVRDLFVAERPGGRLASARDRHALASSWSLPFAFVLAFTGSFFSFAGTIGLPLVATVAFGGDQKAMLEALYEPAAPEDATPAPMTDLGALLAHSEAAVGAPVVFAEVGHYGRADSRISVWHEPPTGGLIGPQRVYDGATGDFLGTKAAVGTAPSVGGTLYALMVPLHFGNFAGLLSQAVWGGLGVAMCVVVLSGLRLWCRKRADQALWRAFGRAVLVVGYGLPLAILASAWGFFLTRPAADPTWWTPWSFVIGSAVAIGLGLAIADPERLALRYQQVLAVGCLLLPVLRLATGGMTWADAVMNGQVDVLTVDLLLLVAGAVLWLLARRRVAADRAMAGRASLEPAE